MPIGQIRNHKQRLANNYKFVSIFDKILSRIEIFLIAKKTSDLILIDELAVVEWFSLNVKLPTVFGKAGMGMVYS